MKGLCLAVLCVLFVCMNVHAKSINYSATGKASFILKDSTKTIAVSDAVPDTHKSKLVAAVLAFPLWGIFGLHRLYLGTTPGVELAYLASFGGLLGTLPFIDFVLILVSKDVNVYAHSSRLFMWTHKPKPVTK